MIALVIITVLLAVVYPVYNDQIIKARRADGKALLYEAAQRQQQFFTENGTFTLTPGDTGLEMETTSQEGYYTLSIAAGGSGIGSSYTLTATRVAPQTADTDCGNFTLTHLNVKGCTASGCDVGRCW